MSETKRAVRNFILITVWTVFIAVTATGLVLAGERTAFVSTGKEPETVQIQNLFDFI